MGMSLSKHQRNLTEEIYFHIFISLLAAKFHLKIYVYITDEIFQDSRFWTILGKDMGKINH